MEINEEVVMTHLRFRDLASAQGWILWRTGLAPDEVIPIQHYVPLDAAPAGAFKLIERTEWLRAPFGIALIENKPIAINMIDLTTIPITVSLTIPSQDETQGS